MRGGENACPMNGRQQIPPRCGPDGYLLLAEAIALQAPGAGQKNLQHRHLGGEAERIGRSDALCTGPHSPSLLRCGSSFIHTAIRHTSITLGKPAIYIANLSPGYSQLDLQDIYPGLRMSNLRNLSGLPLCLEQILYHSGWSHRFRIIVLQ